MADFLNQFKDFFRAIYNLIKHIFQIETGWDGTEAE